MKKLAFILLTYMSGIFSTQLLAQCNPDIPTVYTGESQDDISENKDVGYPFFMKPAVYPTQCCCDNVKVFFELNSGYSRSDFKFRFSSGSEANIGTGINLINRKAKNTWKNLDAYEIGGKFRVVMDFFYLRAVGNWGRIGSGKSHIDYSQKISGVDGTNSTLTTDFAADKKAKGQLYDISLAAGVPFNFCCDRFMLVPLLGYSYNEIRLHDKLTSGTESDRLSTPPLSILRISNLTKGADKTTFCWTGPFVGADFAFNVNCACTIVAGYDFRWLRIHGSNQGNRRLLQTNARAATPISTLTHHHSQFHGRKTIGQNANLGVFYKFCGGFLNRWAIGVTGNYHHLHSSKAKVSTTARITTVPGSLISLKQNAKLKNATLNTYGVTFDVVYIF